MKIIEEADFAAADLPVDATAASAHAALASAAGTWVLPTTQAPHGCSNGATSARCGCKSRCTRKGRGYATQSSCIRPAAWSAAISPGDFRQGGAAAHAFITTPGAAKWYKANGRMSRQESRSTLRPAPGWNGCRRRPFFLMAPQVCARHSSVSWPSRRQLHQLRNIVLWPHRIRRDASSAARVSQRTSIRRDGRLIWWEQGALAGGSACDAQPIGLVRQAPCARR